MIKFSPWLVAYKRLANPVARLVCFPYAGGGASQFRSWSTCAASNVEVVAVQLPGRESRFAEAPINNVQTVVQSLYPVITQLSDAPFYFFGHSNGAIIAYELAKLLQARAQRLPSRLIASAKKAPQLERLESSLHQLPDEKFIAELERMEGTPHEIFANKELLAVLLPMLRADFCMSETYRYVSSPPLRCPISAFHGQDDRWITEQEAAAWSELSSNACDLRVFVGGHFFIHQCESSVVQEILSTIDGDMDLKRVPP